MVQMLCVSFSKYASASASNRGDDDDEAAFNASQCLDTIVAVIEVGTVDVCLVVVIQCLCDKVCELHFDDLSCSLSFTMFPIGGARKFSRHAAIGSSMCSTYANVRDWLCDHVLGCSKKLIAFISF
jgi:hypothetical protein